MKIFLYDGNCPFCCRSANELKARCLNSEIEFRSFREMNLEQLKHIHPDLNQEVLTANVQLIYKGFRYPGFFAVRKLVPSLKLYRYFFWILYLPLVPIVGMLFMNYLKVHINHESKD